MCWGWSIKKIINCILAVCLASQVRLHKRGIWACLVEMSGTRLGQRPAAISAVALV